VEEATALRQPFLLLDHFYFLCYLAAVFAEIASNCAWYAPHRLLELADEFPAVLNVVLKQEVCLVLGAAIGQIMQLVLHILKITLKLGQLIQAYHATRQILDPNL